MPAIRGSFHEEPEHPDTKVPVAFVPRRGEDSCRKISTIVSRLNLGDYNSQFHYGAIAYLKNIGSYIFLYRSVTQPWSVDNFVPLKKNLEDSLDIIDSDAKIQKIINECQGIKPLKFRKKTKKHNRHKKGTRKVKH